MSNIHKLIEDCKSINDQEKTEWAKRLSIMTIPQLDELVEILQKEKRELEKIHDQYL